MIKFIANSMKKLTLTLILIFIALLCYSQDTITIKHTNYTTHFSVSKHYPVLVEWWVTKSMVGCTTPLKRKDDFKPDPKLPIETNLNNYYKESGYDRGHMCPAADNLCQGLTVEEECFYFSNMAPQTHTLNAGDWKALELYTRYLAINSDSIHVWAGNIGELKKIGNVSVPVKCWKVIYIKKTKQYYAYIFNNDHLEKNGLQDNVVSVEDIIKLTGIKFY